MEKGTGYKVRLGLFISIGIGLMIVAIYMIGKKQNMFGTTFHLSAIFKNVSGLLVGNNVRFSGINIGTVENITIISDSTVRVELSIQEDVRKFIKKDAKAIIGSEGLMGNKIINIVAGGNSPTPIQDNAMIETVKPLDLDEIMLGVKRIADNAEVITYNLAGITTNISDGKGAIGKLFSDTVFAKNLDHTIVNLKTGTQGFSKNMSAAQNSFLLKPFLGKKTKEEKEKERVEKDLVKDEKNKAKDEKRTERKLEKQAEKDAQE